MVNIQDCGCPCEDNGKKKQIEERALSSINKIYTTEGATYFPDGTGMVTLPIPTTEQMQAIASVPEMASDIKQLKISDAEHTEAIATMEGNIDTHAWEILQLTNSDEKQNAEIKGITESLISDVDAVFNNTTRDLRISIEREKASAIEAVVNIPATSQTGTYAPSAPITINADNQIGLAHDASLVVKNGQLSVSTQGSVKVDGETIIKDADDVLEVNTAKIAPITYVDSKVKTATAATGKAFGSMAIAADASGVDITMTGIDEATSVTGRIPVCTEDQAGLMTPADRIKIDGIKGEAYISINNGFFTCSKSYTGSIQQGTGYSGVFSGSYTTHNFDISGGVASYKTPSISSETSDTKKYIDIDSNEAIALVKNLFSFTGFPDSGEIRINFNLGSALSTTASNFYRLGDSYGSYFHYNLETREISQINVHAYVQYSASAYVTGAKFAQYPYNISITYISG